MALKQYLLLVSLNALAKEKTGKAVLQRVKDNIDANAAALWVDTYGVGIFMESELSAFQVMQRSYPDLSLEERQSLKEVLVIQVGSDFCGERGSKSAAWLNSRFPKR